MSAPSRHRGAAAAVVIGEPDDLTTLVPSGTPTVSISGVLGSGGPVRHSSGSVARVAVRMLTSGTTGPPKRVDLSYDMLARSVMGPDPDRAPAPTELRRGVAIVNSPLVHIGGVFRVLQCVAEARPFVLLERFELNAWAEAVRKHRPRTVSLVPAALRTVLHSGLTRADLDSIRAVTCGTAPLSADDADAFTEKYGIPVLTSYAATEFGGGVAGWTLPDYQRYWGAKRGSVGRANPGAQLRVVDENGGGSSDPTRSACSRSSPDSWGHRRNGCGPPTWPASTPTASSGSSGAPTRRSSAAGSR